MNGKHRKTLAAVFTDPVADTIDWAAVEALLLAAGAPTHLRLSGRDLARRTKPNPASASARSPADAGKGTGEGTKPTNSHVPNPCEVIRYLSFARGLIASM